MDSFASFWYLFVIPVALKLPYGSECMCLCVIFYSVWDALTDNYISTWDGPDSEGFNGNLSDQEVNVIHIFRCGLCLVNVQLGLWYKSASDKKTFFLILESKFDRFPMTFSYMYGRHDFLQLTKGNMF